MLPRLLIWLWNCPSWVVELVSALGLYTLVAAWPWLLVRVLLFTLASVVYERVLDRNGWSWKDVGEREWPLVVLEIVRAVVG